MENAKQKAIRLAYGEYWEQVKDYVDIDNNGWCVGYWNICELLNGISKPKSQGTKWRPKSLQGIETNNGWISIQSEKDLPNEKGYYYFLIDNIRSTRIIVEKVENLKPYDKLYCTHYQPIVKPLKPIF